MTVILSQSSIFLVLKYLLVSMKTFEKLAAAVVLEVVDLAEKVSLDNKHKGMFRFAIEKQFRSYCASSVYTGLMYKESKLN